MMHFSYQVSLILNQSRAMWAQERAQSFLPIFHKSETEMPRGQAYNWRQVRKQVICRAGRLYFKLYYFLK